jgi:o-succinylbenzoate---CoA ligase
MTPMLPDLLTAHALANPSAVALICADQRVSYAELAQRVQSAADRLADLPAGSVVALLAVNSIDYAIAVHALPRTGLTLLPLNLRLTAAEQRLQLQDAGTALLLFDSDHAARAAELAADGLPTRPLEPLCAASDAAQPLSVVPLPADLLQTIIYTSGTTGRPKGALLTRGNHWANAQGSQQRLVQQPDDVWLAVLPFFHVGGMAILLRAAWAGLPVVILPRFDASDVRAAIAAHRVTIVSLVAVMLQRLLDLDNAPLPPGLRAVLLGGGPAPLLLLERCAARGLSVLQTYGLTESASQAVTLAPADALRKLGSAGLPLPEVELRIGDVEQPLPPDTVGEILLRGPSISRGYLHRPPHPAGWLHTGDLGYRDSDGYLYVVDRRGDLIISGGENIYPAEVEAALLAHPAVAEAGVYGVADEDWGAVPHAAVVLRSPAEADDLLAWLQQRLARYKIPRQLRIVSELPRTASGKLQRFRLPDVH